jgi:hypothetical protein
MVPASSSPYKAATNTKAATNKVSVFRTSKQKKYKILGTFNKSPYLCQRFINKDDMAATVLNDAQLELLKMMSVFDTPEAVNDLKQAISNFFAQKAEDEIDKMWAEGTLTEEKVESFRTLHERTPYKK